MQPKRLKKSFLGKKLLKESSCFSGSREPGAGPPISSPGNLSPALNNIEDPYNIRCLGKNDVGWCWPLIKSPGALDKKHCFLFEETIMCSYCSGDAMMQGYKIYFSPAGHMAGHMALLLVAQKLS